jgi:hypothetical protein
MYQPPSENPGFKLHWIQDSSSITGLSGPTFHYIGVSLRLYMAARPVIPVLGRLRQEIQGCEASLGYTVTLSQKKKSRRQNVSEAEAG